MLGTELVALLIEPEFFSAIWVAREYDLKHYWVQVEAGSPYCMVDMYGPAIRESTSFPVLFLLYLHRLLNDSGHLIEAVALGDYLIPLARKGGGDHAVLILLEIQAQIHIDHGDSLLALGSLRAQEFISRDLGYIDSLQRSLDNQAAFYLVQGDLNGVTRCLKEMEKNAPRVKNPDILQRSLGYSREHPRTSRRPQWSYETL